MQILAILGKGLEHGGVGICRGLETNSPLIPRQDCKRCIENAGFILFYFGSLSLYAWQN